MGQPDDMEWRKPAGNDEMDADLMRRMESLRAAPPRDAGAAARARSQFMADLDAAFPVEAAVVQPVVPVWPAHNGTSSAPKSGGPQRTARPVLRRAFSGAAALALALVLLFSVTGVTAYAARAALPGDTLYSVRTGMERTEVVLARDAARQAELYLEFAGRRVDDIARLIETGRFDQVKIASRDFERSVQLASASLQTVAAQDPQRAAVLAGKIAAALNRYTELLAGMAGGLPETERPVLERAISASLETGEVEFTGILQSIQGDVWLIDGRQVQVGDGAEIKDNPVLGDLVRVHGFASQNGLIVAREVERKATDVESGSGLSTPPAVLKTDDAGRPDATLTPESGNFDNLDDDHGPAATDDTQNNDDTGGPGISGGPEDTVEPDDGSGGSGEPENTPEPGNEDGSGGSSHNGSSTPEPEDSGGGHGGSGSGSHSPGTHASDD